MSRFPGKVAFVPGATSGIGRGTAFAFAREGESVMVAEMAEVLWRHHVERGEFQTRVGIDR